MKCSLAVLFATVMSCITFVTIYTDIKIQYISLKTLGNLARETWPLNFILRVKASFKLKYLFFHASHLIFYDALKYFLSQRQGSPSVCNFEQADRSKWWGKTTPIACALPQSNMPEFFLIIALQKRKSCQWPKTHILQKGVAEVFCYRLLNSKMHSRIYYFFWPQYICSFIRQDLRAKNYQERNLIFALLYCARTQYCIK